MSGGPSQFTSEPGAVPLPEQDEKHGDDRLPCAPSLSRLPPSPRSRKVPSEAGERCGRFDLIDGLLAVLRDAVVEYHALDELLLVRPAALTPTLHRAETCLASDRPSSDALRARPLTRLSSGRGSFSGPACG